MVFPSYLVAITFTAHSPRSVEYHAQFSCTHSAENLLSLSASENGQISFVLFAQLLRFSLHIVFLPFLARLILQPEIRPKRCTPDFCNCSAANPLFSSCCGLTHSPVQRSKLLRQPFTPHPPTQSVPFPVLSAFHLWQAGKTAYPVQTHSCFFPVPAPLSASNRSRRMGQSPHRPGL